MQTFDGDLEGLRRCPGAQVHRLVAFSEEGDGGGQRRHRIAVFGGRASEGDGTIHSFRLHIEDALGRTWQCGTIQLDMSLPERFDLGYIDRDNERRRPIMIHRTIFGSIERFFGILIEHFAGKFPIWMAPVQSVILPINDELVPAAEELRDLLEAEGLRISVDTRTESLNKKIREAQLANIPLILTFGAKEMESGSLSVRTLDGKVKMGVSRETFLEVIKGHIQRRELDLNLEFE